MKALVLGSGGFIGSHVARVLANAGYIVGKADIRTCDDAGVLRLDPERPDFTDLFRRAQPDVCINCTGAASVPASFADPARDFLLNTVRVAQMLEALRQVAPGTRFIHLSSAAVYGNPEQLPIPENAVLRPLSPYGWHKLQAEDVCREYAEIHGLPTLSVRIFSAFGPGLRKQLFWDAYQKARGATSIRMFGTGTETRDFVFVEDVAAALDTLIRNATFDGRAVNVARGEAVSVGRAIATLLDALEWRLEVVFNGEARVGDPTHWQADVTCLQRLGFTPAYTIEAGLERVAAWMQEETKA